MKLDLRLGDCLELMRDIPDASVNMICTDLPYGTTACKWDSVIPFDALWSEYQRITKPNAAIVLTAAQPFTTALIASNLGMYKYCWYWYKNAASGFQLANIQPMRAIEEVVVFYKKQPTYNKQPTPSKITDRPRKVGAPNGRSTKNKNDHNLGTQLQQYSFREHVSPRNVLEIPIVPRSKGTLHPTQKPVALMEYLIETYTNPGDTVLDSCMGSGTTGVACMNLGRRFIGIEKDEKYFQIASDRIRAAVPQAANDDVEQANRVAETAEFIRKWEADHQMPLSLDCA